MRVAIDILARRRAGRPEKWVENRREKLANIFAITDGGFSAMSGAAAAKLNVRRVSNLAGCPAA